MNDFVELHARSAFSFLEGACVPEDLAGACAHLDMPAMALLDRNGVYGSPRFHMAAKKAGVRAHIGSEITCTNGRTYPLLAASREGYRNLCRLVCHPVRRGRPATAPLCCRVRARDENAAVTEASALAGCIVEFLAVYF